jgi:hypothetical protein
LKTKIGKLKIFFIPYHTSTYIKNAVYNFVDFRIKRAGSSNYGGVSFRPAEPTARQSSLLPAA